MLEAGRSPQPPHRRAAYRPALPAPRKFGFSGSDSGIRCGLELGFQARVRLETNISR